MGGSKMRREMVELNLNRNLKRDPKELKAHGSDSSWYSD
jgi:hypothetical protein